MLNNAVYDYRNKNLRGDFDAANEVLKTNWAGTKYIPKDKKIWCPFDEEWSAFYQKLTEEGFNVVRTWDRNMILDIRNGKYTYEYLLEYVSTLYKEITNIVFENCSIIHVTGSVLDCYNIDYADVHDVIYSNIDVEYDDIIMEASIQSNDDERYINNKNKNIQKFGERVAMNAPIQGSAADIIKLAMLKVDKALEEKSYLGKLILQVHDELLLEVYKDEEQAVSKIVEESMVTAANMAVKLEINIAKGPNWLEAH